MDARHEGLSGKWDALTEERDRLRAEVERLEGSNLELQNTLAEAQHEKAFRIARLRQELRSAIGQDVRTAPPLWLEELEASLLIAADREAQLQARERNFRLGLDVEEQEAWDALSAYMRIVIHRWKLRANSSELAAAVHVLQGAVTQHMLHRLAPAEWSSWWDKSINPEES